MPDNDNNPNTPGNPGSSETPDAPGKSSVPAESREAQTGTAVQTKPAPSKPKPKQLPPWKVILHNDDVNDILYVVETVLMLTTLDKKKATLCVAEAHHSGLSLLLTTHQERAELYQTQFASRNLTVTIEPA